MLHKVFARLGEPAEDRARIAVNVSGQSVNSAAYTASLGHLLDEKSMAARSADVRDYRIQPDG